MRELCIENIAMSTRVAFPMLFGCRMSELRRHLVPSPTPTSQEHSGQHQIQQQQVRRNLFGPIDHEENIKFVQNELDKIAQSDRLKWNFDFQKEKPLPGGRLQWEPVTEGVPQAYEMPRLNCLSTTSTTTTTTSTSSITTRGKINIASDIVSFSSSSSSSTSSSVSRVPECPNTTQSNKITTPVTAAAAPTTSEKPTTTIQKTSPIQNQPSCSDTKSHSSEIVSSKHCSSSSSIKKNNNNTDNTKSDSCLATRRNLSSPSVPNPTRARSTTSSSSSSTPSQPNITAFMKIRKKRPTETKLEDEQPPALVSKRSKTTPS